MTKPAGKLEVVQLEVGLIENFCEVIGCPKTGEAALVDPAFEVDRLLKTVSDKGWTVSKILITHTHEDHIAGLDEAVAETGADVYCHAVEVETIRGVVPEATIHTIEHEAWVALGKSKVQSIHAPGHTDGCICWYLPNPSVVITGDVLFVGSCGGVNYPQSDPKAMLNTLQQRLGSLPEHTRVYPGHNYGKTETSTLGWELTHNPAFTNDTLETFCAWKKVPVPTT